MICLKRYYRGEISQQADVVLHLDKNSRSSSLEVEETDV